MNGLIAASLRYIAAVDAWIENHPDDEQFTREQVRAFDRNEERELQSAKANLLYQIKMNEDEGR